MTSGLDFNVDNDFCTDPECFLYLNDPGSYWYYHQGSYTILDDVLTNATGQDFELYFSEKIRNKIGKEMINKTRKIQNKIKNQQGLTLVEVMLAVAVGAFVMVGVFMLYKSTATSAIEVSGSDWRCAWAWAFYGH